MIALLLIWLAVCIAFILIGSQSRHGSAGLPLAYFFSLSLIHVPGALLYLEAQSWEQFAFWTQTGFAQTVIGMVTFLVAVIAARCFPSSIRPSDTSVMPTQDGPALDRLGLIYISAGLLCFMSMQFLSNIPSMGAVVSSLYSLMVVGVCLRLWVARETGKSAKWWLTVSLLPLLPLLTLIKDGFLSFGTAWLMAIMGFLLNQSRRTRLGYCLLAPIVFFVALSVFVNYMASRTEYRKMVWYQQVGIADRISRVADIFTNFSWLDLSNEKQRVAIDERLNQNLLVGMAAARLDSGEVAYAAGSTIGDMVIALIPRALWPDKPAVGGGGNIAQQFTGVHFTEGTSVGAGQVLEFYVNFGTWGVIAGFLLWGWVLGRMDMRVVDCLRRGDQRGFVVWFLMGLAMVQPGGNLLEIVVSVASSAVAGHGIGYLLSRRVGGLMVAVPSS